MQDDSFLCYRSKIGCTSQCCIGDMWFRTWLIYTCRSSWWRGWMMVMFCALLLISHFLLPTLAEGHFERGIWSLRFETLRYAPRLMLATRKKTQWPRTLKIVLSIRHFSFAPSTFLLWFALLPHQIEFSVRPFTCPCWDRVINFAHKEIFFHYYFQRRSLRSVLRGAVAPIQKSALN